jgi:ribonuclease-3
VKAERIKNDWLERLFSRSDLLRLALTHSSSDRVHNGQRFEFLGDAVIELVVRWSLIQRCPEATEGDLTRMKIDLVRKSTLARCADRLGLRDRLILGADFTEDRVPDSMAADAFEAVAGALFVDSGFEKAFEFVQETLVNIEESKGRGDPKSLLQEYCQGVGIFLPEYRLDKIAGPPHDPVFSISVIVNGSVLGEGDAVSRKNAEMIAAEKALKVLEGEDANGLRSE